jgi:ADP-ribose pyrophosphatase
MPEYPEVTRYKARLFNVKEVTVPLPDGHDKVFELIDIQNAVTVLPIDAEGNVYFVEQFRIAALKELLELPAGKIEPGEDPRVAAERELREEIGMAAGRIQPIGEFYMSPGYANEYMHCYIATELYPAPLAPDSDEFINVRKFHLAKVKEMIREGLIIDSKTLSAFTLSINHLQ